MDPHLVNSPLPASFHPPGSSDSHAPSTEPQLRIKLSTKEAVRCSSCSSQVRTGLPVSFSTSSEYLLVFTKLLYLWKAGIGQVIKNGDALAGGDDSVVKALIVQAWGPKYNP